MSQIAEEVHNILKKLFPLNIIKKEHYVYYKGTRLFFDFYLKDLGVLVEVQGIQHVKFVRHFHGSIENFRLQKYRDNLKIAYIQENKQLSLARFYYDECITEELVLEKIDKCIKESFYE